MIIRIEQLRAHTRQHVIDLPVDDHTPDQIASLMHRLQEQVKDGRPFTLTNVEADYTTIVYPKLGQVFINLRRPTQSPDGTWSYGA